MKKIVLTGGGSAGHVMPNLALVSELRQQGWELFYIGSQTGIERDLLSKTGIPYYAISTGKLRRYLSVKNLSDPFRVVQGLFQATMLLKRLRPDLVFSKGGFVSVPVSVGAWLNRIPVILHESDLTPGLANRLSLPFATRICATFPETMKHLPSGKGVLTGNPIRPELLRGSKPIGLALCGFNFEKPALAVFGGSLGSVRINKFIRAILPDLLQRFQVVHICGNGGTDSSLYSLKGYRQFEFLGPELPDIMAATDIYVSRAGANFLFELLALKKPALLIPLSKEASRGDQILNAQSFAKEGFSMVLSEEEIAQDPNILREKIIQLFNQRQQFIRTMEESCLQDAVKVIISLINTMKKCSV